MARSLIHNRNGIVLVWAVGISAIIVTVFVWVMTMYPVAMYWDSLAALDMYPPEAFGIINLIHNICGWTLIAIVVGLLSWMLISSFRKEVQQYPIS